MSSKNLESLKREYAKNFVMHPNKGQNMLDRLQIVKQRFDEISDLIISRM
jgi:hypothetical protein